MEDSLIIVFSIILSVLLMFIFPMMDTWDRQDDISYMSAYSSVVEFVDTARNLGYVSKEMYDELRNNLSVTGNEYIITLEHRERIYEVNSYKNIYSSNIYNGGLILNTINAGNDYTMNAGDYFYVSVRNKNKTMSTVIKDAIYHFDNETFKIGVPYGGMVRNSGTR